MRNTLRKKASRRLRYRQKSESGLCARGFRVFFRAPPCCGSSTFRLVYSLRREGQCERQEQRCRASQREAERLDGALVSRPAPHVQRQRRRRRLPANLRLRRRTLWWAGCRGSSKQRERLLSLTALQRCHSRPVRSVRNRSVAARLLHLNSVHSLCRVSGRLARWPFAPVLSRLRHPERRGWHTVGVRHELEGLRHARSAKTHLRPAAPTAGRCVQAALPAVPRPRLPCAPLTSSTDAPRRAQPPQAQGH